MGDYDVVIGILAFMMFSFMVLVQGGGATVFFPEMGDQEPPRLVPESTDIGITDLELENDVYSSENITFVDSSDLPDADYNTSKVAVLENGTDSGRLVYNTAGIEKVETLSGNECGGWLGSSRLRVGFSLQDTSNFENICADSNTNVPDSNSNANFLVFEYQESDQGAGEPQLYDATYSTNDESDGGVFGFEILDTLGNLLAYPVRLWDYLEHFPFFISLFYGGLLAYMVIDILQIG
jgi:hypothetical protein